MPRLTSGATIRTSGRRHPLSPPAAARRRPGALTVPALAAALAAILLALVPVAEAGAVTTTTTVPTTTTVAAASTDQIPAVSSVSAYWLVASDGGIFAFGGAPFYGSTGNIRLNRPMVGISATSPTDSGGYREVASDGGIFDYGDAHFYGSTGNIVLNKPVVGMAATPDGKGYWLVASDGGIFAYGDAHFYGSTGNIRLNKPVVGMAATPDGKGYWLVASDGGIFAYGDAHFYGSAGNIRLTSPIVGMAASTTGHGYWLAAADGGIFTYGDAQFHGSLGATPLSRPIVGMATTADRGGYWFTNNNGAVTPLGDATYWGSAPQVLAKPVVGIAEATGTGVTSGGSYPPGSYGYDISRYQCPSEGGSLPPSPHTIGIVQVEEPGDGVNPCLAQEARWAGGGLNLYIYANYGTAGPSGDGNCASTAVPAACDYGFSAAIHAYDDAEVAGVDPTVPWWLDVEDASFEGHTAASAGLVRGMIDGLHYAGINSVGIYASPGNWSSLVGGYAPPVPYWAADWELDPRATCSNVHSKYSGLPTGPVAIVQYSSPSFTLPLGGMDLNFDDDYAC
jgi:hypothetical protein